MLPHQQLFTYFPVTGSSVLVYARAERFFDIEIDTDRSFHGSALTDCQYRVGLIEIYFVGS